MTVPKSSVHGSSDLYSASGQGTDARTTPGIGSGSSAPPSETRLRLAFSIDERTGSAPADDARLAALALFHRTGRPSGGLKPTRDGRLPALLLPVLDLSVLRADWPAFLTTDGEQPVRTLAHIVDALVDSIEHAGDDAERLKRDLMKIERTIRQTVTDESDATLGSLWDRATGLLFGGANGQSDRMKERRDAVRDLRPLPEESAPVLTCSTRSIERLLGGMHGRIRAARLEALRTETDALRTHLLRILEVDDSHAPEKKDSDHLEASVGAGDIDAEALSGLLSGVPLDTRLPEARRERIEDALRVLTDPGKHVLEDRPPDGSAPELPSRNLARTADEARELVFRNGRELAEFFRAFHTARLEVENRYREDDHDDLLERYTLRDLTPDERRLQAPVFLVAETGAIGKTRDDLNAPAVLLELLAGEAPLRILRFRDGFGESRGNPFGRSGEHGGTPVGRTESFAPGTDASLPAPLRVNGLSDRLSVAALSAGSAFILQTTASDLNGLTDGFARGLAYDGPALFDIYAGSSELSPDLPPYLRAAAALDARTVPSFRFDPGAGDDIASRFSVAGNPDTEDDWPSSRLPLANGEAAWNPGPETAGAAGEPERSLPESGVQRSALPVTPFCAVDFFACDERFDDHFARIPEDVPHELLTTAADAIDGADGIPFVLLAGPDGRVHRYAVTRYLIDAAAIVRNGWRTLREMGGVRNSHVLRRMDEEIERIEAEKQLELDELASRHEKELDRATEAVAETVVSNLAARLLGLTSTRPMPEPAGAADPDGAFRFGPDSTPPADPADSRNDESAPARTGSEGDEQPDNASPADDEPLLVEEACIDTPLCTSCNECTNLNGQIFAYDDNKQAFIRDASAGPYRDIVVAAEKCPVRIIHPGKPLDPDEPNLDDLVRRAEPFN